MRAVDLDEKVIATFYSEEYEEWTRQTTTIEDVLDSVCDDYTVLSSAQPERKKARWLDDGKGFYMCSSCGKLWEHWWASVVPLNQMCKELKYCPKCGADMRGKQDE